MSTGFTTAIASVGVAVCALASCALLQATLSPRTIVTHSASPDALGDAARAPSPRPHAALTRAPCTPRWWPEPPQPAPSFAPTRELLLADALAQLSSDPFAEPGRYELTQLAQCVAERDARGIAPLSGERRSASPLG